MISEFLVYLRLGFEHITDPGGYDHLLFVAALTASDLGRVRRLFWLVTAFTVGHSVTLALATLDLVRVDISLVEILIPLTILATAAVNAISWGMRQKAELVEDTSTDEVVEPETRVRYLLAVGFMVSVSRPSCARPSGGKRIFSCRCCRSTSVSRSVSWRSSRFFR